jgi:5-methylcytosine-specific restriction endonuclease McrA
MKKKILELSRVSGMPVSTEKLLADLRRVADVIHRPTVPQKTYRQHGVYDDSTFVRRFGSWNKALISAGLSLSNENNISDQALFENLMILWQHYGRQPRRKELALKPSTISQTPYNRRFGSWTASLEAFLEYVNASEAEPPTIKPVASRRGSHRTGREPSLRMKWRVLQRDRYTCCCCGASPALKLGVQLHVDHVIPWSKGGETVIENLQTLCESCNLGKSDVMDQNVS